ncbi:Gfo/Idh/MocA family oxidoreductase [Curtobacterium sp. MCPF17_002]|uniref:Gfo/Idh/MocA family protein n=1 Tax=Curtobacterium sp. MCPF17_002 TaxID=2175645 RepID=UPI000DA83F1D|nr:Gfo/Idh/MocA family oxidoreductase [Curtobacterium sp. MCPF17_002]WIB76875.1 Gfo/Idh/MocA family oxidoreductase [Curtobacterium sp. MCPF17_002]
MTLRVGVLSFAHTHAIGYLSALAAMPDVEVLGSDPGGVSTGPSTGELRGAALAAALGVTYADSYDELFAWGPDAVVVTSENARHRELVERAAAAGAHVLCEKPLATTWEDGLAIRDAVQRAGVQLMMAFPVRFASAFDRLRATHDSGALGTVFSVRGANNGMLPLTRDWFTDPELSGGGAIVDHVVHIADLLDGLTGAAPVSVTAVANRVLHAERARAETAGLVTVTYDTGMIATIDCSWSRPDTSPVWGGLTLDVAGTGGTVSVDFFGAAARGLHAVDGRPIELRYGADHDVPMLRTFLDAVRSGVQPQPDVDVGLRTLSVVLAAQESVRTGRTVTVPTT